MLCHSLLAGQDHRPGTVKAEVQVLLLMGMQGPSSTCQEAAYLLLGGQGEVGVHTSNIDTDGLRSPANEAGSALSRIQEGNGADSAKATEVTSTQVFPGQTIKLLRTAGLSALWMGRKRLVRGRQAPDL